MSGIQESDPVISEEELEDDTTKLVTVMRIMGEHDEDVYDFGFQGDAQFAANIALLAELRDHLGAVRHDRSSVLNVPMTRSMRLVVMDALKTHWNHLAKDQLDRQTPKKPEPEHAPATDAATDAELVAYLGLLLERIQHEAEDTEGWGWSVARMAIRGFTESGLKVQRVQQIIKQARTDERFPLGPLHYLLMNLQEIAKMMRESKVFEQIRKTVTPVPREELIAELNRLERVAHETLNSLTID